MIDQLFITILVVGVGLLFIILGRCGGLDDGIKKAAKESLKSTPGQSTWWKKALIDAEADARKEALEKDKQ